MSSSNGPFRIGIGGPVGSGKTALTDRLCKAMRDHWNIAAITNDIYTKEDAEFLTRSGALTADRIMGVETGGCPWTANLILKKHIAADKLKVAGAEYVPLGGTDFSAVIAKVQAANPDVIYSTLNGDSNVSFFKQMTAAGLPSSKLPVMSFSIGEQEAQEMGPSLVEGSYAGWNYFQSFTNEANKKFVAAYQAKFGDGAAVTDPMVHGYVDVYIWKAAVEKAGSFDTDKVRKAAVGLELPDTPMGAIKFAPNQSLYQAAYVGQLDPTGQFKIIWQSKDVIAPDPYDPVAFPGKKCTL